MQAEKENNNLIWELESSLNNYAESECEEPMDVKKTEDGEEDEGIDVVEGVEDGEREPAASNTGEQPMEVEEAGEGKGTQGIDDGDTVEGVGEQRMPEEGRGEEEKENKE
ncbi:neurofilament light polypeptide-like [Leptopilina boulardi]|uniref:neurofilament light polypeptide-like n=1 Tax=Leptopilina boulardi TaxID=63433 RepID=UPI0021F5D6DE|nr:neurofilament light polypeptide-like [Leptopilina boulardi]